MDNLLHQVQRNVDLVIGQLGPVSGIDFGLNRESVAWVDGFIERQRGRPEFDAESVDGLVGTLGSFVGACIAAAAGGSWQWSDDQQALGVALAGDSMAFPFAKVRKQFLNGREGGDSVLSFYDVAVNFVAAGKLNENARDT
jgi:hypothetical protein